jgi:hypothetical protein
VSTYYDQDCPLCQTAAQFCWVDYRARKYFKCPKCTFFQISTWAENALAEHESRKVHYASLASRAPADHLFAITRADGELKEQSDDVFSASFVVKSNLPLTCE